MIPSDVASRLKLAIPDQPAPTQPVTPSKNLADVLSDLVPGQRVLAEIQAMLPNGAYRALVNQREITLSLPFSAKAGDSLELEVVDNDGKTALAVVGDRNAGGKTATASESVPTTLSQTGKLIGNLLGGVDEQGRKAAPAPLNGNRPLVDDFPKSAAELAPVLKEALSKSGVFYEAHQARWVAGQIQTEQLLQEPQGKLSQLRPGQSENASRNGAASANAADTPSTASNADHAKNQLAPQTDQPQARSVNDRTETGTTNTSPAHASANDEASRASPTRNQPGTIPNELAPLVQQQLDALATQTFTWQGQIWPGQQMSWEIDEKQGNARRGDGDSSGQWQTRLKLTLPQLGGIEASLRLRPGNEVDISLSTDRADSESALEAAATRLKEQFEAAGLNLTQFLVKNGTVTE
ncbi:MAG: flagellar hook-length control protein FliK [Rhodocyclales bacterium GT-UBC]|nr:MAG: flagellar hook-length control protein FliK [Rhodocyclales bacterium GT-UBC]